MSGHLILKAWNDGDRTELRAKLIDANAQAANLLPDLHDARVDGITANGIVISGNEVIARRSNNKANADTFRQTWWCLVHTMYLADLMDLTQLDENFQPR